MKSGLEYVDPLNFVLHRFVISALTLAPLLIVQWKKVPRNRRDLAALFLLGVIGSAGIVTTNIGLVYEKSGIGATLTYSQPLFVFCMAVPFLGEKVSASRLLGVLVGFLGVVVLSMREVALGSLTFSVLLLLAGAFLWAVSVIYYKRFLGHIDPIVTNITQLSVGSLLLGVIDAISGRFLWPSSMEYLSIVLYASIGASSIGLTLWLFLLRDEDATVLSSSSMAVPLVSFLFGWMLLQETVEPRSILGAVLIVVGVYLVNREVRNRSNLHVKRLKHSANHTNDTKSPNPETEKQREIFTKKVITRATLLFVRLHNTQKGKQRNTAGLP